MTSDESPDLLTRNDRVGTDSAIDVALFGQAVGRNSTDPGRRRGKAYKEDYKIRAKD